MSATIRNVQSAEMTGRARFLTWRQKFESEFFSPLVKDKFREFFSQLTPEQHDILRQQFPEQYSRVMEQIGYYPKGE